MSEHEMTNNHKLIKIPDKYGIEPHLEYTNANMEIIDRELSRLDVLDEVDVPLLAGYSGEMATAKARIENVNTTLTGQLADIVQVNVKQFKCTDGQYVQGNGVHDDTSGIKDAIAYVQTLTGKPTLFFPNSLGYLVNDTVTIPKNINVLMESHLLYNGTNDKPCLVVGGALTDGSSDTWLKLAVRNKNQSNWGNENSIGIQMNNIRNSFIKIVESYGFTVGVQCMANSNGFAWNKITLGRMLNNKFSLDITNKNTNGNVGWANENLFVGGSFVNQGNVNTSHDRYGVRITSQTSDYYNNSNHFIKPDFELSENVGKVSIPVLIEYGGHSNFEKCRKESLLNPVFAILKNESSSNRFDLGYSDTICRLQDESAVPTNTLTQISENVKNQAMKLVYSSGNLVEKACYYSTGKVNISSCHMGDIYSGNVLKAPASADTVLINADGIQIGNYSAIGVFVNTQKAKRFVISANIINNSKGRLYVVCYDSSGAIITTAGVLKSNSSTRFQMVPTAYGGSFKTGSDTTDDEVIIVSDSVKKIRVLYAQGSTPLQLTSFSIYTLDNASSETMLGYDQLNENYAIQAPTVGSWTKGKRLVNDSVSELGSASSKYVIDGWVCTASGVVNNTSWVASTAYTVGQTVNVNNKVYQCTVAGTSGVSAPYHTSGTATDGTVTWQYVNSLAVFKEMRMLTGA